MRRDQTDRMTETFFGTLLRIASPLARWAGVWRGALARWPWLGLAVAPAVLVLAALVALNALLAGRHGFALMTLFVALPLATLCLILCRPEDGDED